MGVRGLWGILDPARREVPLRSLEGQTIAVDLSVWVCANKGVRALKGKIAKPHLRNLFFRVLHLLKLGVKLIFVVDGEAPVLKWGTILNRITRGVPKQKRVRRRKGPQRRLFDELVGECLALLDVLGIPHVRARGEAEAMCAHLNQQGPSGLILFTQIVDACITEDGDVFLYGARQVYRNFTLGSSKEPTIAVYNMEDVESMGYSRETLVALALLLGCDFAPKGVPGVGRTRATDFVTQLGGENILERFNRWAEGKVVFPEPPPRKPPHCSRCRHTGTAESHRSSAGGCPRCGEGKTCTKRKSNVGVCSCQWHSVKAQFEKTALEREVMTKALKEPGFPDQAVIDEFLLDKETIPRSQRFFSQQRPKMTEVMTFALENMKWSKSYTRSKVIELVTAYDLTTRTGKRKVNDALVVDHVVRKRIRRGILCLEVAWKVPKAWHVKGEDLALMNTIERSDLFKSSHPATVADFEAAANDDRNRKGGRRRGRRGPRGQKSLRKR